LENFIERAVILSEEVVLEGLLSDLSSGQEDGAPHPVTLRDGSAFRFFACCADSSEQLITPGG
jgi:hypothetical protein